MMKAKTGYVGVLILSLIPILLWAQSPAQLPTRFSSLTNSLTSLGQLTGLIGLVMYCLTLFLNARLKFLEDYFGGLNRVYMAHHLFGGISFILLLIHPISLIIGRAVVSMPYARLILLPSDDWTVNFGIASLLLMISLLMLTFFIHLPYHIWRLTHKFLGLAFFLGAIHSFFIPSDISRIAALRLYVIPFIGIGLASIVYRTLLSTWLVKKYAFTVKHMTWLKNNSVQMELIPNEEHKGFIYEPGQFVFIQFKGKGLSPEPHPFSISSYMGENLKLTAKILGDFTSRLNDIHPNTIALIEGPYGRFSFTYHKNTRQIWIAGGIGITPFVSMARSLPPNHHVDLYYQVRTPDEAVYLAELEIIAKHHSNFRVIPHYSKTQGRLTADVLYQKSGGVSDKDIYLCGPPRMMYDLKYQLKRHGVGNKQIHSEEFQMYEA